MDKKKKIAVLTILECIVAIALIVLAVMWIKKSSDTKDIDADTSNPVTEQEDAAVTVTPTPEAAPETTPTATPTPAATPTATPTATPEPTPEVAYNEYETQTVSWNSGWEYAEYSQIHTSDVTLYKSVHEGRKIIAVNAGHGTKGGSSVKTLCHPDGTPKVTGGSTSAGSTHATAIAVGTTMLDGTPEAAVTLKLARIVKDKLLDAGFSVLMIRESEDTQLDNIARTVFANQNADCHIALHYDSTENDKGFYYMSVPDVASYRNMEPVASHWKQHHALGDSLLSGMYDACVKVFSSGSMPVDLTQTSYSTVASVDVEVGDRGSDYSEATMNKIADGIVAGLKLHYGVDYSQQ